MPFIQQIVAKLGNNKKLRNIYLCFAHPDAGF